MAADRESFSYLRSMVLLVPFAAGAGIGAMFDRIILVPKLADRFWRGAQIDATSAPSQMAVNATAIIGTAALWYLLTALIRRREPMLKALGREALAFIPALSILVVVVATEYGAAPDIILYANHAVVFSIAALVAINAFLISGQSRPAAAGAVASLQRRAFGITCGAALLYWAAFSAMGILQYYSLDISYTDTADWEQMLWNTLDGRFLMSSAFPHMFFGEHVQFIQLLLLPLYALTASFNMLMVVKSAALASGAFAVYLVARRRLGSNAAAACFALAYLLYPAMQYTDLELAANTFRPEVFAIPALLWAVYFLDAGRMLGLSIASFFALAAKEEMALPVAMIGVLLLVKRRWAWGAGLFMIASAWFLASVLWVIPYFRSGPSHMYQYYLDFGPDPTFKSILWNAVTDPLHTLAVIFRREKVDYLLLLFIPLGLMPFFSWRMMLVVLPSFATTLLASREPSFTIYYHYQIALVPFLVMGAVYGTANCAHLAARFEPRARTKDERPPGSGVMAALTTLVLASSLVGNVFYGKSPISLLFYDSHMYTDWHYRYVPGQREKLFFSEVRPLVPADASVSASEFLATYFAARRDDFRFPDGVGTAEYIVLDTQAKERSFERMLNEKGLTLEKALQLPGYDRIFDKEGFLVYRQIPAEGAVSGP